MEKNKQLLTALKSFDEAGVICALEEGASANALNSDGMPVLHDAASAGAINFLNILLKYGADIDLIDSQGKTALHYAVTHGDVGSTCSHDATGMPLLGLPDCITPIIAKGANVNIADNEGCTPLDYAVTYGRDGSAALLRKQGAVHGNTKSLRP